MTSMPTDPAEARKRRKEIIQSQRGTEAEDVAAGVALKTSTGKAAAASGASAATSEKKPPKKRKVTSDDASASDDKEMDMDMESKMSKEDKNKKTQIRYDPDVPMDKDQLAAWRREQRRVRNRESAAASRQRIRSRICELEDEVGQWKEKYTEAMQRLEALEAAMGPQALAAAAAAQGAGK